MRYLKQIIFVSLVPVFLLTIAGAFAGAQPRPDSITLRVPLLPFLGSAPFFIAEEEGLFREQGLSIKYVRLVRSTEGLPSLAQGKLDVLHGTVNLSLLNAMARGAKIKFVADKTYISPKGCSYNALIARPGLVESGRLKHPSELRGLRFAINPISIEGYYVEKVLSTAGLCLDDIKIIDVPTPLIPEALNNGAIDLAATTEPWVTRILEARQGVIWMPIQQIIPDFQFAVVSYGPRLLEENPGAGRRFMVAYLKAAHQYNQGKTERNLKIVAKYTGLDQELIKKTCWLKIRPNGQINIESILDFQSWALKKGHIDRTVPPSLFWDPQFVEFAHKTLGQITP